MGLFDLFSFKKEGKKVFSKETFKEVLEVAREKIVEQVKSNIPGAEKKAIVDDFVIAFILKKIKELGIKNGIILWLVDRIIELIPSVTQLVYDFLKEKIENL